LPDLPAALEKKFIAKYSLPLSDAKVLCDDRETAAFFENIVTHTNKYKQAANWILGPVKSYLNDTDITIEQLPVNPKTFAKLIEIVEQGSVSFGVAASKIFPALLKFPGREPMEIAREQNVLLEKNDDSLNNWIDEVLSKMPDKVSEYKKGKKNLIGLFSGEVKKISKGKADMQAVNKMLNQKLNQ
jgi:aspartyl-tRNA(Asn)/glutamyl-tRNA(Gln) amidotransferase subunit B